jgi:hypothetical protein
LGGAGFTLAFAAASWYGCRRLDRRVVNHRTVRNQENMHPIKVYFRKCLKWLKPPVLVVMILSGFMLEFLIELPFRALTAFLGARSRF